ncbi:Alanyl-tRNA synthetase [Wickerhamomyces ciferrii]|uniref:Alanyl-tRNA synthetase n=1 Tax=Wickerhamomyces ciferrii (strain ATCC 14091 / BCRC 22168 / CBS 111 / JCM 3599 / NBRC 0793 / NRRL Y-1031 F-60-10) TaxID=1206466 RepID=K0KMK6_WICCF|nr:Alanyl-tRNA synthetase [Wickerhamomyces ciferrii]CCH42338.1 Alanyl-tRNA synthetase [Wickerhamomyces ciferrii]
MGTDITPVIVGALQCQKNSFLKEFQTIVISCKEEKPEPSAKNKKSKSKSVDQEPQTTKYAVELEDTILFPEGGGQPSDKGTIVTSNDKEYGVSYIRRDQLRAVHLVDEPIEVGTKVNLKLDWKRRLDHMQQHTGQHLLSAVLDKYELPTLSWSMGELINYIELPRSLTDDEVDKISEEVNDKIAESIPISVEIPDKELVNKQKMPDDYDLDKGILRVIKIGELDQNPCCGTHLSSTSQILSIALLHQTSVRGTNSRLHFLAGDRVRKYAIYSHGLLKKSSQELSCQFDELNNKIQQLNINYKKTLKNESSWKEEIANYQSNEILTKLETSQIAFIHRPDVGLDYLTFIFKSVSKSIPKDKTVILLSGEGQTGGSLIIFGSNLDKINEITKSLQSKIKGLKGGGKGKWQGKINSFEKGELEDALNYLKSL